MPSYSGHVSTTQAFINHLYDDKNFRQSSYLAEDQVIEICNNIGVFKLKGYVKEIRYLAEKNIDDVLFIYFFDKYFSKVLFDLTIRIEAKIKSILISECYALTQNHFFYLEKENHRWDDYSIDIPTLKNWKILDDSNSPERYQHYMLFYGQNYDFISNKRRYLGNRPLLDSCEEEEYNYPPFKYLIESATMGSVKSFIQSLKINAQNIDTKVSHHFGIGNSQVFQNYLARLNEIRNRLAHGGRIFNRTFRSATGIGKFQSFRTDINNHKSLDVYLFLYYILNKLEDYDSFGDFMSKKMVIMIQEFRKDRVTNEESFMLISKYSKEDTEKIVKMIIENMSR